MIKFTDALESGLSISEIFESLSLQDLIDKVAIEFHLDPKDIWLNVTEHAQSQADPSHFVCAALMMQPSMIEASIRDCEWHKVAVSRFVHLLFIDSCIYDTR